MQFLKTLFWVLIAVVVVLFASHNWFDVTVNLWGDIQADIKLRTRVWSHRRRIDAMERSRVASLATDMPVEDREPVA